MPLGEGFRRLFRRDDAKRDVRAELESHIEMKANDLISQGIDPDVAWAEARERFGSLPGIEEECLEIRAELSSRRKRRDILDGLKQDLRIGARTLLGQPRFSGAAFLTLALGIGGTTAIFSVFKGVILEPLPYPEPHRLVQVMEMNRERAVEQGQPWTRWGVSPLNYRDYRKNNTVFEEMGWITGWGGNQLNLGDGDRPGVVKGVSVSASLFDVLGVRPVLGHVWSEERGRFSFRGSRPALISQQLWEGRFGADPDILGRVITLDAWPHEVVGVLPDHFPGLPPLLKQGQASHEFGGADVYVPLLRNLFEEPRGRRYFHTLARLRPGVTVERAREEMATLAAGLAEVHGDANTGWTADVLSLQGVLARSFGTSIGMVLGAMVLTLILACANTANLLLAQSTVRRGEMAIRASLGGGRWRLVRQLLTEHLLLASAAGVAGVLLAYGGNRYLVSLIPQGIPRAQEVGMDGTVLAFAAALTMVTALVFGLVPALRGSGVQVAEVIKGSAPGGRKNGGVQRALIVGQIALALVLLVGGGLLVRNFVRVSRVDLGFDVRDILVIGVDVGRSNMYNTEYYDCDMSRDQEPCRRDVEAWRELYERVEEAVRRVPGVRSASTGAPMLGPASAMGRGYEAGRSDSAEGGCVGTGHRTPGLAVQPGFFETVGIQIVAGRSFTPADPDDRTALINRTLAERIWPGESPLGKRTGLWGECDKTIVGVTAETRHYPLADRYRFGDELDRMLYVKRFGGGTILARTERSAAVMIEPIREAIEALGTGLPVRSIMPLEERLDETLAAPRFYALLIGIFAGFAVILVAGGLYGTVAFAVSRRTREIGVRRALGAHGADVQKVMAWSALQAVALGVTLGAGAVWILVRLPQAQDFLYGMDPLDPLTFGVVALLLAGVVLAATYLPARRATRVAPLEALRYE